MDIESRLFEIHEADLFGEFRFIANGFLVSDQGTTRFVTAAHVAFDGSSPRNIIAISHDQSRRIDKFDFKRLERRPWADVCQSEVGDPYEGLQLGRNEDITPSPDLCIRYSQFNGYRREEKPLDLVAIGALDLEVRARHGYNQVTRKYDNTLGYVGRDKKQITTPGCSGAPVLSNGRVIGVHCMASWIKGVNRGAAAIFTQEDLS